jgi:hypothetical protein
MDYNQEVETELINRILNIPSEFNTSQTKSITNLVIASGYVQMYLLVTTIVLENAIRREPRVMDSWQEYSENKRTTHGWFWKKGNQNEVGYYSAHGILNVESYDDIYKACAAFIKHELEDIRKRQLSF